MAASKKVDQEEYTAKEIAEAKAFNTVSNLTEKDIAVIKANRNLQEASQQKKKLIREYSKEDKVKTSISPMYRPHFGNVMTVTINGISIRIKVDGSKHTIPKTFADEIARRIKFIDSTIDRQNKMANIKENSESSPGGITMF